MSLLRDTATARIAKAPPGGIIRCGVKVLTKTAASHPQAVALYNQAMSGTQIGFGMKEAEAKIAEVTGIKFPLRPANTPWFNLSARDFQSMGGQKTVNTIMAEYGEDRNDGFGRQLYRFPVLFNKSANVDELMNAAYVQGAGEPRYRSEYKDGERICTNLEPIDPRKNAEQFQAGRKKFMPRQLVSRGPCDPASCNEFATGVCKFTACIDFRIPKVSGLGFIRLKTSSAFASYDIFLKLDELWKLCLGSPPQQVDNPIFFFTKIKKEMKYFDNQSGKMATSQQWVPIVECDADLTRLIELQEQRMLALAKPTAVPSIALPTGWGMAAPSGVSEEKTAIQLVSSATEANEGIVEIQNEPKPASAIDQIIAIADLDAQTGFEVIDEWAERKFGPDWQNAPEAVLVDLKKIEEGSKSETLRVLTIINKAAKSGIDATEIAKYLRMTIGGQWRSEQVAASAAHLDSLLSAGSEVAKTTIKAKIGEAVHA